MKLFSQYRGLRREIYVLFTCVLIDNAGSMIGPMLTLILSVKMGMNAGEIAAYFLFYSLLSLPIQLLGGRLTDRINKKLLINVCDISTALIYIVCGVIGLNRTTLIVYMFGSLLQTVESPAYNSLVADLTTSGERERAYSLNYLGMNLGLVLAPTLGGFLITNHIGLMFILSGVFELLSIIVFDIFVRDIRAVRDESNVYESKVEGKSVLRVLFDNKVLIPFILIFAISMLVYNMYGYLMPLSLTSVHGDSGSILYGTLSSLNCVTVLVFTTILTALFAKRTSVNRMVVGNVCEVAGLALFFVFLGKPVVYYIAIVLFTFGEILNTITTTPHLTKRIPLNYRGRIMALCGVLQDAICAGGRYGIGKIYDNVGADAAWLTVLALGILTIIGYLAFYNADRRAYPSLYEKSGIEIK